MRKFVVNVNGASYEVCVEEIEAGAAPATPAAPVAAASAPVAAPAGGQKITSPMPGNIWDVKCKPGDVKKAGDVLLILEAMKMENEILAPRNCKVLSVNVQKGASVNSGDVLCVIE